MLKKFGLSTLVFCLSLLFGACSSPSSDPEADVSSPPEDIQESDLQGTDEGAVVPDTLELEDLSEVVEEDIVEEPDVPGTADQPTIDLPNNDTAEPQDPGSPIDPCTENNGGCDPLTECSSEGEEVSCSDCPSGYEGAGETGCVDIDECLTNNGGCDLLTECVNNEGGFECGPCPAGYIDDGQGQCADENECLTDNGGCDPLTQCINLPGSWECGDCPTGYNKSDDGVCKDIDECSTDNGGCDPLTTCINLAGSNDCGPCPNGFEGSGPTGCEDVDECATNNGGCDALATCVNTVGSFQCGDCPTGFTGGGEGGCVDINECLVNNGGCDPLTACTNSEGSFECSSCPAGYEGTGNTVCVDTNECAIDNGGCDPLTACSNNEGSFECSSCPTGYEGDGLAGCADIDECLVDNGGCDPLTLCTNMPGGLFCGLCPSGYAGDGNTGCEDVDECAVDNGGCDPLAACTNTVGSFTCGDCPTGFSGGGDDGCIDIDECAVDNGGCDPLATCTNNEGSFSCGTCPEGYTGTGATGCVDINECSVDNGGCDPLTACTNQPGSLSCGACPAGYSGTGATGCVDINECSVDNGGCDPLTACTNTVGSFTCGDCPAGFSGGGEVGCTDINECSVDNGGCDLLAVCTNNEGSFSCGTCPEGYTGTGATGCVDINECTVDNGGCDPLAACTNEPGSLSCGACPAGYSGTGATGCVDINECSVDNGGCDPLTACTNNAGGFSCGPCPAGYTGTGDTSCEDVDECVLANPCGPNTLCTNTPGSTECTCLDGWTGDGVDCTNVNGCSFNNGGCDPLTTCTDTLEAMLCGACPEGYTGDGYAGCLEPVVCMLVGSARNQEEVNVLAGCNVMMAKLTIYDATQYGFPGSPITNLDALESVQEIKGYLSLYDMPALMNIEGLSNLKRVGDDPILNNHVLSLMELPISNLDALSNLEFVGNPKQWASSIDEHTIRIQENPNLTSIAGLSTALENLVSADPPEFNFVLSDNPLVTDLSPLSVLTEVRNITLELAADSFAPLQNLEVVHNLTINVYADATVSSLNLPNLETARTLDIESASNIAIGAFENLSELTSSLNITGNLELSESSFSSLIQVYRVSIYGFKGSSFPGLPNLTTIVDRLAIQYCTNLLAVTGFTSLTTVGDDLDIKNNPVLHNISGLYGASVDGQHDVSGNPALCCSAAEALCDMGSCGSENISGCDSACVLDCPAECVAINVVSTSPAQKITPFDGEDYDGFSGQEKAVSMSGDILVVGSTGDDDLGPESGSVYCYARSGSEWTFAQKLTAFDGLGGDGFGKSVAVDGETLVVGASQDDEAAFTANGSAYVYTFADGAWTLQQKITPFDGANYGMFGEAVAISGDTLVVGSENWAGSTPYTGGVYIYTRSGTVWTLEQKLTAFDGEAWDQFGRFVEIDGDTVVVGAYFDDDLGFNSGAAYVYTRTAGTWILEQKLTPSDLSDGDGFGHSLSIRGDTLLVGAPAFGVGNGAAYLYNRSDGVWVQQQKLTAFDGEPNDAFGGSVIFNEGILAVGANQDNGMYTKSGSTYHYTLTEGTWGLAQKITAFDSCKDCEFGYALSMSGDTLVVGARHDSGLGTIVGAAYVFDLQPSCNPDLTCTCLPGYGGPDCSWIL